MSGGPMQIGSGGGSAALDRFMSELVALDAPRVLELGTKRSDASFPTEHSVWAPHASQYMMSDFEDGLDVDVVADVHELSSVVGRESFDAVIAVSVWEHVRWPWVAAEQVAEVLAPGGVAYISTHHTFPQHGYPHDATRWDIYGLVSLFEWANLEPLEASFAYPCTIIPPPEVTRWNTAAPAWLNVDICVRRPAQSMVASRKRGPADGA